MITKAVIPVAGLGTRLFPATKEQPKTMLPLFARGESGGLCVKPLLQMIFEQLFTTGLREFYFVVGRDKEVIQKHFTPDQASVRSLREKGKNESADNLSSFYQMIDASAIEWVDQPAPRGFGDAVLRAEPFVGNGDFLVHAGDTLIMTNQGWHLYRCISRPGDLEMTMVVKRVRDPERFGVIRSRKEGEERRVLEAIEKPKKFVSDLAIMPVYSFSPSIFGALREVKAGVGGEVQLTDGIQKVVQQGKGVNAIELPSDAVWLDVGTPESYWEAQEATHRMSAMGPGEAEPVLSEGVIELQGGA